VIHARELLLRALGCPEGEADPAFALCIMLETLAAEAEVIADEGTLNCVALRALARRLDALKDFTDEYMTVEWSESESLAAQ
jgi:hypothetical protein